ncbi:MAG TPA: ATP-dependent DNA ligase [Candidatus Diapherotrites archaeon]|nr:ATP-dependent DNA ligase [Candidatus Diapherotrites archaeon]
MYFDVISEYFEKISKTTSRLEMTDILKQLFSETSKEDIQDLIYFCQGTLGPKHKTKEINIGQATLISLVSEYLSVPQEEIKEEFYNLGDIGLVIEKHHSKRKQSTLFSKRLVFRDVFDTFKKISETTGTGSTEKKQRLFKFVLFNSNPASAKYLVRFPISFRLGFGDSTIIDALASLSITEAEELKIAKAEITEKYQLVSDLGLIGKIIKEKGIEGIESLKITAFIPIKSQLCERAESLKEIHERLKVVAVDTKIDGFRQQIHKKGNEVKIFSRQEEDITKMFPDIVEAVKKIQHDFIIDCESIAYDPINKKYHTFQITITRKRKYDISEKSKELPLHLKVFDCLYLDGQDIYHLPFGERRKFVERYFNHAPFITPTKILITSKLEEIEKFFNEALEQGFEGIIAKDLEASYKAGSRGYSWIKFKKSYKGSENLDTIDAVIVGAFYGQGKRTDKGIGALLVALYDRNEDRYFTLAKIGTGLTDATLLDLAEKLESTKLETKPNNLVTNISPDFYVTPEIVVEINYDEITKSPIHTASFDAETNQGLALRFPRLVKIRTDKGSKDTTSQEELEKLFSMQ